MSYRLFLVLVAVIAALTAPALAGAQVPLDVSPTLVYSSGNQVQSVAFAVTADGTAHVLMDDSLAKELLYAHDASGSWSSPPEVIDTVSDAGPFNLEMDVGPDDRVQAVFDPGPGSTYGHAIRAANGSWSVQNVTDNARWLRLAVASDNVTHGAYSTGTLQYGSNAGGTWSFDPVRVSGGFTERSPTLVFEGPGAPSIGFVDRTDLSNPAVLLARDDGGTWDFETVSSVGEGPLGMVRATDGTLHAVFARNPDDFAWVHATNATGTWQDEVVLPFTSTGVGGGSELDVALVDDQVLFADTTGGVRLILGKDGAYRSYLAEIDAREVRMHVVGARLLLLVNDTVGDVFFIELPFTDDDDDDVPAAVDLCPDAADPGQQDTDGDGIGDACNDGMDADGDEYADALDNCPAVANPDQANANAQDDDEGDACDCDDGDGLCTGWTSTGGFCDASSPERDDDDCDYTGGGGCGVPGRVGRDAPLSLTGLIALLALRRRRAAH